MNNNVPEIRFKGFTDAWEQRKLGEVFAKIRNAFVGTATPFYVEKQDGYFYLQSNNIKDGQVNRDAEIFISQEFYEKQKDKLLKTGDLVMVQSGHVGHTAVITEELNNSAAHALIMFNEPNAETNSFFLNYGFQNSQTKKRLDTISTGNTIRHILASEMNEFNVEFPSLPEQTAIGNFFHTLDDTITLHKRKLDRLRELKKGYLQQMFPQAGERVPRVRFAGYSGEWVSRKAGEIFISVSDKNHPNLPVLSASQEKGMVRRDEIGIDIKYDENALGTYKRIMPEQFAIHLRSFQGGFAYSGLEGITSPAYTILDFGNKGEHYSEFWKEVFTSPTFIKRLETITYGIRDGRSISFSDFSILVLPCPTVSEQIAIGRYFRTLDEQINMQTKKVEQLQKLKNAYLRKMFI